MKSILKYVFASCLGTILAFFSLFLILFIFSLSFNQKPAILKGSTLVISLDNKLPELTNNLELGFEEMMEEQLYVGLHDMVDLIENASTDPRISSIFLKGNMGNASLPKAEVIYNALKMFKETSDKPIISYTEYFNNTNLLLSSVADSVFINPRGSADIRGFGVLMPYFAEMFEKLDAKWDVYYAGKYKSAIEPLYKTQSSPENDYQMKEILEDWQKNWIEKITSNRATSSSEFYEIINKGEFINAQEAKDLGMVDDVRYLADVEPSIKEISGRKKIKYIDINKYYSVNHSNNSVDDGDVAVIYLEGEIRNDDESKGMVSMDTYKKVFDDIEKDDDVKAVVLRVNSPGGDALESDIIWDRVEKLKSKGKKVVASFGTYAASGGYYIACGAEKIVSEPDCITGSIGVFSAIPDLTNTFKNKLGIYYDSIGTGANTFIYSTMVHRNASQNKKLQAETESVYQIFLNRVAQGRNMSVEKVHEVAQGRVWTGEDAIDVGLVDQLGELDDAIVLASELAELGDDYSVSEYPKISFSPFDQMVMNLMASQVGTSVMNNVTGYNVSSILQDLSGIKKEYLGQIDGRPQCRLPYFILN